MNRHVKVSPGILNFAAAAYVFHRELFHPLPDHTMRKLTRDRFDEAWAAMTTEERQMLSKMKGQ